MTKADEIRQMTDEELAFFIHNTEAVAFDISRADIWVTASSVEAWLDWLKQEVSDNG